MGAMPSGCYRLMLADSGRSRGLQSSTGTMRKAAGKQRTFIHA
jgi:hypothetical protein